MMSQFRPHNLSFLKVFQVHDIVRLFFNRFNIRYIFHLYFLFNLNSLAVYDIRSGI